MPSTPKIQLRDSNNDASVYPITLQSAVMDASLKDNLTVYITEYNISEHQTNLSASSRRGTRMFTLSEAIEQVPNEYKRGGLNLTFYNGSGGLETYILDSSVWSSADSSWSNMVAIFENNFTWIGTEAEFENVNWDPNNPMRDASTGIVYHTIYITED